MQARTVRPPRLLGHHLMQAPDDGPLCRRPQRHAQPEGVDRHRVGGRSGVEIVNHAGRQRGEDILTRMTFRCSDASCATSLKRLQSRLQRSQRFWL